MLVSSNRLYAVSETTSVIMSSEMRWDPWSDQRTDQRSGRDLESPLDPTTVPNLDLTLVTSSREQSVMAWADSDTLSSTSHIAIHWQKYRTNANNRRCSASFPRTAFSMMFENRRRPIH